MTITSPKRIGALALVAAFAVAACGGGATASPSASAAASQPAASQPAGSAEPSASAGAVSGAITVSGSSTVEPVTSFIASEFKKANPDFNATVEGPGTGDGFKRFCNKEIDIADASRAIKTAEKDACAAAGVEFIELKVAFDGITVMTNPANDAVTCLSFADLYALMGPESQGFKSWSDAAALGKELGSNTTFPAGELVITGPGEESGTFDYFNEAVIQPIAKERGKVDAEDAGLLMRPDYVSSGNDNVIVQGIGDNPTSLGWVGFAFAEENAGTVKELEVAKDANGTCVAPSQETIADGSYPIARPLFIYVNKAKATENAALSAFVDFYLAQGTIENALKTVPYVNLPAAELDASRAAWSAR